MAASSEPQNHVDDMLVAVGEASIPFLSCPNGGIGDEPNVQSLEKVLVEAIGRLTPSRRNTDGFVDSQEVSPNGTWRGAREMQFTAQLGDDTKMRKWTLVVRYKNLKQKESQVSPFFVDLKADSTVSVRCVTAARAHFVRRLRDETFGMKESTWQIKPNESLLSYEAKALAKIGGRVEKLERQVFGEASSSNEWQTVPEGAGEDNASIPSTNESISQKAAMTPYYPCWCALTEKIRVMHPRYRTHAGKKNKDGSYDMRTLCNRDRCKQCGGIKGSQVILVPDGIPNPCCLDALRSGDYQQHEGQRCQDGSYDMRFKENFGRCKVCGIAKISGTPYVYMHPASSAPAASSPSTFTKPMTSNAVPAGGEYACCCMDGPHNPLYRSHAGTKCKDGSYDMRFKQNKTRCKQCGGKP